MVHSERMSRIGAQFLVALTVTLSAVNAQCATLCSLQFLAGSPSSQATIDPVRDNQHACCPHHSVPTPKPNDERPCAHPAPPTAAMRSDTGSTPTIAVASTADLLRADRFWPQTLQPWVELRTDS